MALLHLGFRVSTFFFSPQFFFIIPLSVLQYLIICSNNKTKNISYATSIFSYIFFLRVNNIIILHIFSSIISYTIETKTPTDKPLLSPWISFHLVINPIQMLFSNTTIILGDNNPVCYREEPQEHAMHIMSGRRRCLIPHKGIKSYLGVICNGLEASKCWWDAWHLLWWE